jgi:hypothetical protein
VIHGGGGYGSGGGKGCAGGHGCAGDGFVLAAKSQWKKAHCSTRSPIYLAGFVNEIQGSNIQMI